MKRKLILSLLAAIPAVLLPLAASAQIAPDKPARPVNEPQYKWRAYAGVSYTSINQVNQSRYGLIGPNIAVTRDWGRYFGVTVDGAWYSTAVSTGNPGNPSVYMILAGPEVHGPLFEKWNFFGHALFGGEHTGGEGMRPDVSFAGGGGGGVEYQMTPHLSLRLSGDAIAASFTVANAPAGASPHMTRNSRGNFGIAYRF